VRADVAGRGARRGEEKRGEERRGEERRKQLELEEEKDEIAISAPK